MHTIRAATIIHLLTTVVATTALAEPQPGDIFREYKWNGPHHGSTKWTRVTDPAATADGAAQFLPNGKFSIAIDDLAHAVKAEIMVERVQCHAGTANKRVCVNSMCDKDENNWLPIPEATKIRATNPDCFQTMTYPTVEIPLSLLVSGNNRFAFTTGGQVCHNFNWGQFLVNAAVFRIYYDDSKPHPTGSITSPTAGSTIGEDPTLTVGVAAGTSIRQVDFIGYYEDWNWEGDNIWTRWHYIFAHGDIDKHLGTDTTAPYAISWDTSWVPDQSAPIKLAARIVGADGIIFMTPAVGNVTFRRTGRSVKLFRCTNIPEKWQTRAGKTHTCTVNIPSLENATAAKMYLASWSGVSAEKIGVNGHNIVPDLVARVGKDHDLSYDELKVPTSFLQSGDNVAFTFSSTTEHGIEVQWPGLPIKVEYETSAAFPDVHGFVLNTRDGAGALKYYGTIDGAIWRHDIVDGEVISHKKILDGPASRPAISPDGNRFAFIKRTSGEAAKVMLANTDGSGAVELADCLANSLIDFPDNDWVYFTIGGYHESTSGTLKRVSLTSRKVEEVMQIKDRNGVSTRIAQIQISGSLARAVVRTGDETSSVPYGEIVALSLTGDDRLDHTIGTRFSCAAGLFADGQHVMDGLTEHDGFDIRKYSDASIAKTFANADAFDWPPNNGYGAPLDTTHGIFDAGAATNSDRWMLIVTGGDRNFKWDATWLINWKDEQTVLVTRDLGGKWDQGDFWVGDPATVPVDTVAPTLVSASTVAGVASKVHVRLSEPITASTALATAHYAIDKGVSVTAAAFDGGGDKVVLTTSALASGTYTLTVNGLEDLAGNTIATGSTTSFTFSAVTTNQQPVVSAGTDQTTHVGSPLTLAGSVTDDGLPTTGTLTSIWTVSAGDTTRAEFEEPTEPATRVTFSAEGTYELTLTADDGDLSAADSITVTVLPEQSIVLDYPTGGEQWAAGSDERIRWTTTAVDDVMILFSPDGGVTWEKIAESVARDSPDWGAFPWTVPDTLTDEALVSVQAYLDGARDTATSDEFSIVAKDGGAPVIGVWGCAAVTRPTLAALLCLLGFVPWLSRRRRIGGGRMRGGRVIHGEEESGVQASDPTRPNHDGSAAGRANGPR